MTDPHRANVLVTSCLKTPVDPNRKTPLALYERQRVLPLNTKNQEHCDFDHEEREYSDSECEDEDEEEEEERPGVRFGPERPGLVPHYRASGRGDRLNLREIFFSNQEYYGKLEELKRAHLRTMAELEDMYRKKLRLSGLAPQRDPLDPPDPLDLGVQTRFLSVDPSAEMPSFVLRRTRSAVELRRVSRPSSDEDDGAGSGEEEGPSSSPREHIKNMWLDFQLRPQQLQISSSSLRSLPGGGEGGGGGGGGGARKGKKSAGEEQEGAKQRESWRRRVTVPRPFRMALREAARRQGGVKTRSEVELENAELRRRLEELGECQRQFRASPVPASVRLPVREEEPPPQGQGTARRRQGEREEEQQREEQNLRIAPRPFSFLERDRRLKEQREEQRQRLLQTSSQQEVKPFRARPVPKAVYEAAAGDHAKEEQLYRSIQMQARAREMLRSAAMPPSMQARSLSQPRKPEAPGEGEGRPSHRPRINADVPDFDAKHRLFKKSLESRKEVRPVTSCEPFTLRTSQRERTPTRAGKEQGSPRPTRWPHLSPREPRTPSSSVCSSLSGSLELLPAKVTDASRKRQEAVRKALEEKRRAQEEEESEREKRRRRERKLQKVISKRAQASDPHLALYQTCPAKLQEFRKQDLQRKREYQKEMKEIHGRVKERPLLLEQVAQRNAKTAVERRYAEALLGCGLTEDFLSGPGNVSPRSARRTSSTSRSSCQSDSPVRRRKKYLNVHQGSDLAGGETQSGEKEKEGGKEEEVGEEKEEEEKGEGKMLVRSRSHSADESYHYSDDQNFSDGQETYSENSEEQEEQKEDAEEHRKSNTLNKASDEEN